jgi:hypothetical protein
MQVIKVTSVAGNGTEDDPVHVVTEYWTLDGKLLNRTVPPTPQNASGAVTSDKK